MEGAPERPENVESLAEWRALRDEAFTHARALIQKIEGYAHLAETEKVSRLDTIIVELSRENKNRYVVRELSLMREILIEEDRHRNRMAMLGVAA